MFGQVKKGRGGDLYPLVTYKNPHKLTLEFSLTS